MIPNTKDRELSSQGVTQSSAFGISLDDSAHIMTILRDTLYSDKVLAVLREYGANAWDSHRQSGKPDLPIKVTLPTQMEPTLSIRDFGAGLSHEDVFQVYTQYGASTKRNSDTAVGMLGIGSKSGFAYSDSFTITSHHGGMKRVYVAVLDKSEKGVINLLDEEPSEETGVEISIAIRPEDIKEFVEKAQNLYQYFVPRPLINTTLPELPTAQLSLTQGVIYDSHGQEHWRSRNWVAVMGCIPYRIDLDQLKDVDGGVPAFLNTISGALFFDIGEVQVSASREELKYSLSTKKVLVEKFNQLIEEYVRHTLEGIELGGFSEWDKRVRAQVFNRLGLPVPASFKHVTAAWVPIKEKVPGCMSIAQNKEASATITVSPRTRLILRDDYRPLEGFSITTSDYLVTRANKKVEWADLQKDLDKFIADLGMVGIPVLRTSQMDWAKPWRGGKQSNEKHRVNTFVLKEGAQGYSPYSRNWEVVKREPTDEDVFVILYEFQTGAYDFSIYKSVKADRQLLLLDKEVKLPTIYGYKTTEKKPKTPADCKGKHYPEWRKEFLKKFDTPVVRKLYERYRWSKVLPPYYHWAHRETDVPKNLEAALGKDHPLLRLYLSNRKEMAYFQKHGQLDNALEVLYSELRWPSEADTLYADIRARYPLFASGHHVSALWESNREAWIHYVKSVDHALGFVPVPPPEDEEEEGLIELKEAEPETLEEEDEEEVEDAKTSEDSDAAA